MSPEPGHYGPGLREARGRSVSAPGGGATLYTTQVFSRAAVELAASVMEAQSPFIFYEAIVSVLSVTCVLPLLSLYYDGAVAK